MKNWVIKVVFLLMKDRKNAATIMHLSYYQNGKITKKWLIRIKRYKIMLCV